MKEATEPSIVCTSQVGLDAMGTRQSNRTGLARTCWKSLLGSLATTILASLGAFMAPELLAQTVERGQALPRPLPPGPGEDERPPASLARRRVAGERLHRTSPTETVGAATGFRAGIRSRRLLMASKEMMPPSRSSWAKAGS